MRLIIHHPEKQTVNQRWTLRLVTTVFWMFWVYLWLPLISLLAWIFGIHIFEYEMLERGGYQSLLDLLGIYFAVIFLMGGGLVAWAGYNILRFRGESERRKPGAAVTMEAQAQHFNVDAGQLEQWRKSQKLIIDHGDNSQITRVSVS